MTLQKMPDAVGAVGSLLVEVSAHHAALLRAKSLYRERLAPDFNPLDFMKIDELNLSRVIAWLLRPDGSHGQGGAFLQQLLALTGGAWSPEECSSAKVYLEHGTGDGRIDIMVRSRGRVLAIENKPDADDQPYQLQRYLQYLDGLSLQDYRLLYLTPNGTTPNEKSITSKTAEARVKSAHLHLVSYNSTMLEWLSACRAICRADRVTVFLDEVSRAVRKKFQGVSDMSDQEHITDVMAATPQSVEASLLIANTALALKSRLAKILEQQLGELIEAKGWKFTAGFSPARYSAIRVDFDARSPVVVSLMFDRANFNSLAIGIEKKQGTKFAGSALNRAMNSILGASDGTAGDEWPWWQSAGAQNALFPLPRDWDTEVDVWIKIARGRASIIAMSGIEKVADACLSALVNSAQFQQDV